MKRMEAEERHESAVNEVMDEIDDQLDDSDGEDDAYLVTTKSGTGAHAA